MKVLIALLLSVSVFYATYVHTNSFSLQFTKQEIQKCVFLVILPDKNQNEQSDADKNQVIFLLIILIYGFFTND